MNWEAIGTIAEVIAAIAVVATLVYFAVQIKQAKHEITALGMQARASHATGVLEAIYMSPRLADIHAKLDLVASGEFDLTKEETVTFGAWCHVWMQTEQGSYYLLPKGSQKEIRKWWLSTKVGLEFWEKNKGVYDQEFVAYMEGLKSEVIAEARSSVEILSGAK